MIQISYEKSKIVVTNDGEELIKTTSLKLISQVLNEEYPEAVEAHILTGNTIHFDIDDEDQKSLRAYLRNDFYKEHSYTGEE